MSCVQANVINTHIFFFTGDAYGNDESPKRRWPTPSLLNIIQ